MKDKKVLIFGGGSGVGLALAKQIRAQGAHVIIASRSAQQKQLELQNDELLQSCQFISCDITQASQIKELFQRVGQVDHIALTVKSPLVIAPFLELEDEDVREAFETKLWGQYNVAKLAHRYIKPHGSIIFTSGSLAARPYQGFSTLSIINGAVESLTKVLSLEFAPIRVNAVCPGFKTLKQLEDKIPLGLGMDEQISHAYLFLMNDSYITGTSILSDGGAALV